MSYRRAIPAATPAICRSSRGRAGRVSHISRNVPCTSVVFMGASFSATGGRFHQGRPRESPDLPPMSPGPCGVTMDDVTSPATTPAIRPTPPLVRLRTGRLVAGVAGGVAQHLGVPVLWVRAGFVVLAGLSGAGVLA